MRKASWIPALALLRAACGGVSGATDGITASWRDAQRTDVRTGDTFRIAALKGKLVVIEPMAIWCVNCQFQQEKHLGIRGSDDLVDLFEQHAA